MAYDSWGGSWGTSWALSWTVEEGTTQIYSRLILGNDEDGSDDWYQEYEA